MDPTLEACEARVQHMKLKDHTLDGDHSSAILILWACQEKTVEELSQINFADLEASLPRTDLSELSPSFVSRGEKGDGETMRLAFQINSASMPGLTHLRISCSCQRHGQTQ